MSNKRTLLLIMGGLLLAAPLALAGAAGEAAAAEPITLTVWTTANVEAFPDGQNENNNEIHSFLQEQIGYQLNWLIGSRENQLAKLSLLIASGDPPDLMTPLPPFFWLPGDGIGRAGKAEPKLPLLNRRLSDEEAS